MTLLVLTTSAQLERVREVGRRVPDLCLGNPEYRMITLLEFEQKHSAAARSVVNLVMKHQLEVEARSLQTRYDSRRIQRKARDDVFAAQDPDGAIAAQLDLSRTENFQVLVFSSKGVLLQRWPDVPEIGRAHV